MNKTYTYGGANTTNKKNKSKKIKKNIIDKSKGRSRSRGRSRSIKKRVRSKSVNNEEEIREVHEVEKIESERISSISKPDSPKKNESPAPMPVRVSPSPEKEKVCITKTDKYSVLFTEKHRAFFVGSRDRIFSNRTSFSNANERFNISFAMELKIPSPKTNKDFDEFIGDVPNRVLSVAEGECAVVINGRWENEKLKTGKIIHAVMVYNNGGKYYIFNANDDPGTYDDGFYDCYPVDNPAFVRPLRVRKTPLHYGFKEGACFTISYALKLLCEVMPFDEYLDFVKHKSLEEIMAKCFDVIKA